MKRVLFLALLLSATALPFVAQQDVNASVQQCLPCQFPGGIVNQLALTVTGNVDCAWTRMQAIGQVTAFTSCSDGFCHKQIVILQDCDPNAPGPWSVRAQITWQCKECTSVYY